MDLMQAIQERHSVRAYTEQKIEGAALDELRQTIEECNGRSGLNMQLCLNEPTAFAGRLARYGKFVNVRNYIALIGKKDGALDEKCGYYGEIAVLKAAQLGLNTCWVGLTYSKGSIPAVIQPDEKLRLIIAVGYGTNAGVSHKMKSVEDLCRVNGPMPDWFRRGVEAARLAPTALNQQKFRFELDGDKVKAAAGLAFYAKVDLGIAKYHFELAVGEGDWSWAGSR